MGLTPLLEGQLAKLLLSLILVLCGIRLDLGTDPIRLLAEERERHVRDEGRERVL